MSAASGIATRPSSSARSGTRDTYGSTNSETPAYVMRYPDTPSHSTSRPAGNASGTASSSRSAAASSGAVTMPQRLAEGVSAHGHGERLSAIDASFLQLESDSAHMHVAWTAMIAAREGGAPPCVDALRERVSARLEWLPRCRQRLLPAPLGLGEPRWVDDPDFDVARHVVELCDAAQPVSRGSFAALRDALLSTPLDRDRPLWQLAIVPRLSDGGSAIIGRVHHAMADGAAALQIAMLPLDADGSPDAPAVPWRPEPVPGSL